MPARRPLGRAVFIPHGVGPPPQQPPHVRQGTQPPSWARGCGVVEVPQVLELWGLSACWGDKVG